MTSTDTSFLEEHVADAPEVSSLEAISAYAYALAEKREEAEELELKLKEKKEEVRKLEQELLPSAMLSVGLTSLKLASGQKVEVKEDLSCSVKDYQKLYNFLEQQGDDALMKTSIEVGKLPQNILDRILRDMKKTYDLDCTSKLYIHPSTLKAYFKRLCAIGTDDEAKVPLAKIDEEMISAFTYYKVSIVNGK